MQLTEDAVAVIQRLTYSKCPTVPRLAFTCADTFVSRTKSLTVKDSLSGAVKRLRYSLNTSALIYWGGAYQQLFSICMGHCVYRMSFPHKGPRWAQSGASVEITSRAICAARLRRLEAAFSHTSSLSSRLTGLLARRPMAVNASAAAMKEHIPTNIHVK